MEPGTWAEWVAALGNIGVAGAAIVAARQGIQSLSAWRREAVGRRRIELAEEVLADFYEARDALRWVRSPMAYSHESKSRPGRDADPEDMRHHRDTFYVPLKRLTDLAEFFSKMRARRYRVIATFGQDAAGPYEEIWKIHTSISVSAQALMRLDPLRNDDRAVIPQERLEAVVWEGYADGDDEIVAKLDELLKSVEARFRPEIVDRTTL